jgi:hypothetical protein
MVGVAWVIVQKRIWVFETFHRPLTTAISSFEREGLKVDSPVMLPRIPGVAQAIRLTVDGHEIFLLEFDLLDSDQWETVAGIHNSQSTNLLGEPQAAVVSKPLVMVGHDRHPQEKKLLKAFQSF